MCLARLLLNICLRRAALYVPPYPLASVGSFAFRAASKSASSLIRSFSRAYFACSSSSKIFRLTCLTGFKYRLQVTMAWSKRPIWSSQRALLKYRRRSRPMNLLWTDLCCGSGCLLLGPASASDTYVYSFKRMVNILRASLNSAILNRQAPRLKRDS